jgi:malate dehydrogenase (oxaloacetate-decarboxylating)
MRALYASSHSQPMKIPEILQVETSQVPGSLASVLNVIAELGLVLEHVTMLHREQGRTLWEITVEIEEGRQDELLAKLNAVPSARFVGWSDRVFDRHRGGKIEMRSRMPISSMQILRDIYTPGVARVCLAIQKSPEKVFDYTYINRAVAVITDGSAILGLGNIGARPGLPVIEGKAALFASLVGLSGWRARASITSWISCARSRIRSARFCSRTSRRPAVSKSSTSCARGSTCRCFTMISMRRRS